MTEAKFTFTKSQLLNLIALTKDKKIDLDVMFMFLEGMNPTSSTQVHNTKPINPLQGVLMNSSQVASLEEQKKAIDADFKPQPKINIQNIGDVTPKKG